MDKLYEYEDGTSLYRFSCDCLDSSHSLDIFVKNEEDLMIELIFASEKISIWEKLVKSVKILLGKKIIEHEFILRVEDVYQMKSLLGKYTNSFRKVLLHES